MNWKNRKLNLIFFRFIIPTTRVVASPIELFQSNGIRLTNHRKPLIEVLSSTDFDVLSSIYHMKQNTLLQFPERRLIEYDCGKLQTLAKLLFDLKSAKHRCLIYTQMINMLDLLELFLNYHGYTYLRLDGTIDSFQRQILIERFNNDEKIFLLILSTRTGGFHVNLTGADTVIFYDSDWNSIIDKQVQDRCERIAQMKDVHIYRLVNKNTIEEKQELLSDWTMDNEETQFEEVEDEIDRQAAVELLREINTEEEIDDQPEINQVEEELRIFDEQV
jgi:E1A-binding protein p400